jgi:hypothetical protein
VRAGWGGGRNKELVNCDHFIHKVTMEFTRTSADTTPVSSDTTLRFVSLYLFARNHAFPGDEIKAST